MAWNNLTFLDNATSIARVSAGVNDATGGWLFGGLLLLFFIINFMVFYGRVGVAPVLVGNGVFLSIISLFFINAGLVPTWVIGITISMLIFGLLAIFMSGD